MQRVIRLILAVCLLFSLPAVDVVFAAPPQQAASGTLHNLIDTLKDFRGPPGQVRKQQTPAALRKQIAAFRDELYLRDARIRVGFDYTETRLQQPDMPPGLLQRHQDTRGQYRQRMGELLDRLNVLAVAGDSDTATLAEQTLVWLEVLQSPVKPSAFDPSNLPWRQPPAQIRAPLENKEDIDRLFPPAAVNVAGTALTTLMPDLIAAAHGAPGNSDSLATTEAQITPEIETLAANLGNHPVRIYEWVRANIEFIPTYGSVQGSQLTLELRRGNAFDMASLFIALLRAAEIPARYVYGTVTADIDKVMSWLDAESPARAAELMAQGGIPHTVITRGGEIIKIRFEHVWTKAWVDFIPSRGARHERGKGDSWAPIDVAFKWYDYHDGIDLSAAVPFNADGVLQNLLGSVQYNAEQSWMTGLDADYIKTVFDDYHTRLDTYLQANNLTATDTLPGRSVVYPRWAMLPSGLPFRVDAESAPLAALPKTDAFQHKFTFKLYRTATDQALDSPALSHEITLPEIGSKRLSLTWEPATEEDAAGLAAFRAEAGRTGLPVHLFNLKPVLKLDDEVLAAGPPVQMGRVQYYSLNFRDPHFNHGSQGILTAGDETVIGIDGNGLTPAVIEARMAQVDPNSSAAENLHQTALHFWVEHDLLDAAAARVHGVRTQRMPSAGLFSTPLNVHYVLGIPSSGNYRERRIDVKHNVQTVAAPDAQSRFDFMSHIGVHGSFLEGNVLDQLFGLQRRPAASAVQLLMEANEQDIRIYTVTADNAGTVMPQLAISAGVREDIERAVAAGKQVIVPQKDLQREDFSGIGYIIRDPLTGAGAYLLDGGLNGAKQQTCGISTAPLGARLFNELTAFLETYFLLTNIMQYVNLAQLEAMGPVLQAAVAILQANATKLESGAVLNQGACLEIIANGETERLFIQTGELVQFETDLPEEQNCSYFWDFGDKQGVAEGSTPAAYLYEDIDEFEVKASAVCEGDGVIVASNQTDNIFITNLQELRLEFYPNSDFAQSPYPPNLADFPSKHFDFHAYPKPKLNRLARGVYGDVSAKSFLTARLVINPDEPDIRAKLQEGGVIWSYEPIAERGILTDNTGRFQERTGFPLSKYSTSEFAGIFNSANITTVRVNVPDAPFNRGTVKLKLINSSITTELDFIVPGIIVLDPGHGGDINFYDPETNRYGDGGKVGYPINKETVPESTCPHNANVSKCDSTCICERDLTLNLAFMVRESIESLLPSLKSELQLSEALDVSDMGAMLIETYFTRIDNTENPFKYKRPEEALRRNADIFLSLHFNGVRSGPPPNQLETYTRCEHPQVNWKDDIMFNVKLYDNAFSSYQSIDNSILGLPQKVICRGEVVTTTPCTLVPSDVDSTDNFACAICTMSGRGNFSVLRDYGRGHCMKSNTEPKIYNIEKWAGNGNLTNYHPIASGLLEINYMKNNTFDSHWNRNATKDILRKKISTAIADTLIIQLKSIIPHGVSGYVPTEVPEIVYTNGNSFQTQCPYPN